MDATVSEIHAYPLRPEHYAEPLFHTQRSRRQILEHLVRSSWLGRASELLAAPDRREEDDADRTTGRVLASWREVDRWWEQGGGVDRVCYLLRTASGREEVRTRQPRRVS